jgi:hypothetical protein
MMVPKRIERADVETTFGKPTEVMTVRADEGPTLGV